MRIDDLKTITLGSTGSGASVFNGTKMEPMMLRLWIIIRGNHGITGGDSSWRDFARRVLRPLRLSVRILARNLEVAPSRISELIHGR